MCGFTVSKNICSSGIWRLDHRGPDSFDFLVKKDIIFRHFRLSIQDFSRSANQPYIEGDKVLVYNGEIYNVSYLEKTYLSKVRLKTTSDTEVLFHLLSLYGSAILDKIDGIFAFVFYDGFKLIAARDVFGVKPLYYNFHNAEKFIFSSEIGPIQNALQCSVNRDVLPEFIKYKYVGEERTVYSGISKVMPGQILVLENETLRSSYFNNAADWVSSENKDVSCLNTMIEESVKTQLVGDAEIGIQLSGGVDSSLLRHLCPKNVSNFSSIFDNEYSWDEKSYIEYVSNFTETNTNYSVYHEEYFAKNFESMLYMSGGVNHPHTLAIMQLSELASRHVKVLLSGEGADELFLGYERYRQVGNKYDIIENARFYSQSELEFLGFNQEQLSMSTDSRRSLLNKYPDRTVLELLQILEIKFHLENLLHRHDIATMRHGIEGRVPFLGLELSKYALKLDKKILLQGHTTKVPLKALCSQIFNPEFAYRPKIGYRVPFNEWIEKPLLEKKIKHACECDLVNEIFPGEVIQSAKNRTGMFSNLDFYSKFAWTAINLSYL